MGIKEPLAAFAFREQGRDLRLDHGSRQLCRESRRVEDKKTFRSLIQTRSVGKSRFDDGDPTVSMYGPPRFLNFFAESGLFLTGFLYGAADRTMTLLGVLIENTTPMTRFMGSVLRFGFGSVVDEVAVALVYSLFSSDFLLKKIKVVAKRELLDS